MPSRVAEILLEQGRQAARARELQAQIWGGTVERLGALPGEAIQQHQQQQRQQLQDQLTRQRMEVGGFELEEARKGAKRQTALDALWGDPSIYGENGEFNRTSVLEKARGADPGLIPHVTDIMDKAEAAGDLRRQRAEALTTHDADTKGEIADRLLAREGGVDPATFHLAVSGLAKAGVLKPSEANQFLELQTPEQITPHLEAWKTFSPKLRGEALAAQKPVTLAPGAQLVRPGLPGATPTVLATGAAKLDTEAELARDAATLGTPRETPTAATSKTALAALQAPARERNVSLDAWRKEELGVQRAHLGLAQAKEKREAATETLTAEGIKPGTQEYRIAQDLAYGKLTFADFNRIYGRAQKNATLKAAIYDQAGQLNPQFNPAAFEMGFRLASTPKVQQQLASLDNVIKAAPDLIAASNAAQRSGITTLNKILNPVQIGMGNQKFTDFRTAQIAFADELSGALGYGSATDMSREMGFNMTDKNLGPAQFAHSVQNVVLPFVDRKRATLLNQMGVYGQPAMNPAASAPSGQPAAPSAPQEGTQQPIPSIPGGIAEYRRGKWIRVK